MPSVATTGCACPDWRHKPPVSQTCPPRAKLKDANAKSYPYGKKELCMYMVDSNTGSYT